MTLLLTFRASILQQRAASTYGVNVRRQHTVLTCGVNVRCQRAVSTYGINVRRQNPASTLQLKTKPPSSSAPAKRALIKANFFCYYLFATNFRPELKFWLNGYGVNQCCQFFQCF